jgi:hypothetical protein
MNEFYLNEHSVHGQYGTITELKSALEVVLGAKTAVEGAGFRFLSDSRICLRQAVGSTQFFHSITEIGNKELQSAVLSWLSKSGPFWPPEQTHSEGDLFECLNEDGAGTALAEAACRHSSATPCDLVSFAPSKFNQTPLTVVWIRSESGEVDVRLGNYWELAPLSSYLAELNPITDWDGLHSWAKDKCKNLLFSKDVIEPIKVLPFKYSALQQIQILLLILDDLSKSHAPSGALSAHGLELHKTHFTTERGRFSDETPNKLFNFDHPKTKEQIQCSWHGKVRMDVQYRIHFQWPKPKDFPLWVAYIGPKLTRG